MQLSNRAKARRDREITERQNLRFSLVMIRGNSCEFPGCREPFSDMHEILTRGRGGSPVDPDNILLLCRSHHEWVTTHEDEARALGLVRARTAEEHIHVFRPWQSSS